MINSVGNYTLMQSLHALSFAPDARNWLMSSRHPRILHVFDHACNLVNERGEVLSIVTPQIGNGPFNLVVNDKVLFLEYLTVESQVSVVGNQVTIGDLMIHTANAYLWNPRPDWEVLHAKKDGIFDQIKSMRTLIKAKQVLHQSKIASPQNALLAMKFSPLPITNDQSLTSDLASALASADISSALTTTSQLAGLGSGLTPAGDDFLLGAIYAAWIIHPPEVAKVLAEEITNTAAPLTTSLSAAWLRSAGKGEGGILWHLFFDALITGSAPDIQLQITKLLSVGETSGADALAGFVGVLLSWAVMAGSRIP